MSDRADAAPARDGGGVDPRGLRFAAGITSVLLLIAFLLGLTGLSTMRGGPASFGWFAYQPLSGATFVPGAGWAIQEASIADRALDPAFLVLLLTAVLFLWGVVSPRTAPWGVLYRKVVAPRLTQPADLEDPRPPRFAQGVGLVVVSAGLLLHLAGVPWALPVAAALALVAAFLNAAFGLCLGCQMYLLLQRFGIVGRSRPGFS